MSLFNAMSMAGSGMSAQTIRLNAVSSNLANAGSVGSSEATTYHAKEPIFSSLMKTSLGRNQGLSGVEVKEIIEKKDGIESRFQPEHPMANEDGYIFFTNVNPVEEMAHMIAASRSFQMNVEVANTSKQLLLKTLSLGR